MENENKNQQPVQSVGTPVPKTQVTPESSAVPATTEPKSKKGLKYLALGLLVVVLGALGFYAYSNPDLFRASITEVTETGPADTSNQLYISDLEAGTSDSGRIAVRIAQEALTTPLQLYGITFKLNPIYTPATGQNISFMSGISGILFDEFSELEYADIADVNTKENGETTVSFFVGDKKTINSNRTNRRLDDTNDDPILFYLNVTELTGVQGGTIDLNAIATDVVVESTLPGLPFMSSLSLTSMDAGTISFVAQDELRVLYAAALRPVASGAAALRPVASRNSYVLIQFSDVITNKGSETEYKLTDDLGNTPSIDIVMRGDDDDLDDLFPNNNFDQSVVILETPPGDTPNAGELYTLEIGEIDASGDLISTVKGNQHGFLHIDYRSARLEGYKNPDDLDVSAVTLDPINPIEVLSSTEIILRFTDPLQEPWGQNVTGINVIIDSFTAGSLTVDSNGITQIDDKTYSLTTSHQVADAQYFVYFSNVRDLEGELLHNNKILSFFGHTNPVISVERVFPSSVTNDDPNAQITVAGHNLDTVDEAFLGSTPLGIIGTPTENTLDLSIPTGLTPGDYNLNLVAITREEYNAVSIVNISAPSQVMHIAADGTRANPNLVKPGDTVTFEVEIEDLFDIVNVNKVTIDLHEILGISNQEMTFDSTDSQSPGKQYYKYTTTVHPNAPTSLTPYLLEVEVQKGNEIATGYVSLTVTNDILGSVPPVISQAYVNPATVAPDGVTPVKVTARVSDQDGADTIVLVTADLGQLGAGTVPLEPSSIGVQIGFFESAEFTIPENTPEGNYVVTITAEDVTGETSSSTANLNVSNSLTIPSFNAELSYLTRKSVPKDDKTIFSIHVMVSDPNGISDINTVTAYFGDIGLPQVSLLRDPSASASGNSAAYSSPDLTIPKTAPLGVKEIRIVAIDSNNDPVTLILQLDVTYKDTVGDTPLVFDDKSYTLPRVAVNDGQTRVTLYAFVRDDDDDLESVVVILGSLGQVGEVLPPELGSVAAPPLAAVEGGCPTGSNTIVCMQPSFKEGRDGQWFILPDVTISPNVSASSEPYYVEVVATDAGNKVARGQIPIYVQDSDSFVDDQNPPVLIAAIPVGTNAVEVLFNEAIFANSITPASNAFAITGKDDVNDTLTVLSSTINAAGNVVTLTVADMVEGKEYVLTGTNQVTDVVGSALVPGTKSRANFTGFVESVKPPIVNYIAALDPETIEIEFMSPLRPTSVNTGTGRSDFNVRVIEADTMVQITVHSVEIGEFGKTLVVITDPQKPSTRYRAQIEGISSAAGVDLRSPVSKPFKSVNFAAIRQQQTGLQADLNGDGKVDFIDFTMFSAVYGQTLFNSGSEATGAQGQGLSPIPSDPDSTVPHSSAIN